MVYKSSFYGPTADSFGEAGSYLLLQQVEWIDRRNETVSFEEQGTTHRHIEFDCTMPGRNKRITWRVRADGENEDGEEYAILPVTFFGKGDVVALRVTDESGSALPTLPQERSLFFVQRVLGSIIDEHYDDGLAKYKVEDVFLDNFLKLRDERMLFGIHAAVSEDRLTGENMYSGMFGQQAGQSGIKLRRHRKTWCESLIDGLNADILYVKSKSADDVSAEDKCWHRWNKQDTGFNEDDADFNALCDMIADEIDQLIDWAWERKHKNTKVPVFDVILDRRRILTKYVMTLSLLCDTYPLLVLLPIERANKCHKINIAVDFETGYREDLLDRWRPDNQIVDLAFQTYCANETQIEVKPIPGGVLTDCREEIFARKWKGNPIENGDTYARPLNGRVVAGHLNVNVRRERYNPICRLRLTIMHNRGVLASFALWTALLAVLNMLTLVFVINYPTWSHDTDAAKKLFNGNEPWGDWGVGQSIISLYRPENTLAILALVLSLWVARRISTVRHVMVEGLSSATNAVLNADLGATIIAYIAACAGVYADGENIVHLGRAWLFPHMPIVIAVAANVISCLSFLFGLHLWRGYCIRRVRDGESFIVERLPKKETVLDIAQADGIMPSDRSPFAVLEGYSYTDCSRTLNDLEMEQKVRKEKQKEPPSTEKNHM